MIRPEPDILKVQDKPVMLRAIPEMPALRLAVVEGRIDGSRYAGECACLCGTVAKERGVGAHNMPDIKTDSASMAERFFMGIKQGDTPQNNAASKLVLEWIEGFQILIGQTTATLKA